jgi:predicted nucleotidyltransferase
MYRKGDIDTVQVIVERLVAEYSPQKIVLFGSRLTGKPGSDSDIDLLIIKDTNETFFDRLVSARRALSGTHKGIPLDLLVLTPGELEARLREGDQFLAEITEKGQLLYAV